MQQRGCGTESISLILELAFDHDEMNQATIGVVGMNTNALNFYINIGFKQEGIQEQGHYYNNEHIDFIMMRILCHEWW